MGLDLSRPFGTRDLLASNPALKRWAILARRDSKAGVFPGRQTAPVSSMPVVGNDQTAQGEGIHSPVYAILRTRQCVRFTQP